MKKYIFKRIIIISYVLSVIIVTILSFLKTNDFLNSFLFGSFSSTTVLVLIWYLIIQYGWRIKYINLIFERENLNGTWKGSYYSENSKGNEYKGDIFIVIRQDLLNIHIQSFTSNTHNVSFSQSLDKDLDHKLYTLVYSYSQENIAPLNFEIDKGTCVLNFSNNDLNKSLIGKFWMLEGNKGTLNVNFFSSKHIDSYQAGLKKLRGGE